jgi:hypothetical protein
MTQNVETYYGCPVFTAGDTYNQIISGTAIDPNSAVYLKATEAVDTKGFYAGTGDELVNNAGNGSPLLTVQQKVPYHKFPVKYPWQSSYFIEPLGDAHALVVQTQTCHAYELYGAAYKGGVLSAYSGANWDLTKPFAPLAPDNPSSMASGLSLFAGAVKWEEYQAGCICHAIDWTGVAGSFAQWKYELPASDTDQLPYKGPPSDTPMPYGAKLRLKASFSTAGWGPESTAVAQALKTYGMYVSDTGSGKGFFFTNAQSGGNPWNMSDLNALDNLRVSDFDVVKTGSVLTLPGH